MKELKTDVVVIGVGLAGSFMVGKLQEADADFTAFESNGEPGGIARYLADVELDVAERLNLIEKQSTLEQLQSMLRGEKDWRNIHTLTHVITVKKGELHAILLNGELIRTKYYRAIISTGSREATKWELKIVGDDVYGFYSVSMVLRLIKKGVIPAKRILIYGDTLKTRILIANLNTLINDGKVNVIWVIPPNKDWERKYEIDNIEVLWGELVKAKGDKWVREVHIESEGAIKQVETNIVVLGRKQIPATNFLEDSGNYGSIYFCGEAKREFKSVEDIIQDCESTIRALLH